MAVQSPARSVRCSVGEHVGVAREPLERPVAVERLEQALQVAAGIGEIGFADLDVVQTDDRVDLDRVRVGFLAHHLAMDLALRRHVHDEVAAHPRVAPQPSIGGEPATARDSATPVR